MANADGLKPPLKAPWWLKPTNKVFIQLSRLGLSFGGESPVVLTVKGRKSGRDRSTPVTPMTVDGEQYVAVTTGWDLDARGLQNGIDKIQGTNTAVPQAGTLLVFKLR